MSAKRELITVNIDGQDIQFESSLPIGSGVQNAGNNDNEKQIKKIESFADSIRPVTKLLMESLKDINNPDEINIEFGIKIGAKAGVVFASANTDVNFKVSIKWKNTDKG